MPVSKLISYVFYCFMNFLCISLFCWPFVFVVFFGEICGRARHFLKHNRPYALTSRLHNNDAMLGVKLRARVVLAERIGAQQLSQCAGPGQPGGVACMQGLVLWLQCLAMAHVATFDPQRGWAPFCDVICIRSIMLKQINFSHWE